MVEIRKATEKDNVLQELEKTVVASLLAEKNSLRDDSKSYFNSRDKLAMRDGIIARGDRATIPKAITRSTNR